LNPSATVALRVLISSVVGFASHNCLAFISFAIVSVISPITLEASVASLIISCIKSLSRQTSAMSVSIILFTVLSGISNSLAISDHSIHSLILRSAIFALVSMSVFLPLIFI